MKKLIHPFLFLLLTIVLNSCDSSKPSLCDCLTKSEYAQYGSSKQKQCNEVFMDKYGTEDPSTDQMSYDYYNCKE